MFRNYRALLLKGSASSTVPPRLLFGQRGVYAIPHPQKAHRGGEDAFFLHPYGIGVADGVGGYSSQGIDPSIYTRNLMTFALEQVKANASSTGTASALEVMVRGWQRANASAQPGGCAATAATIVEYTFVSIWNLGDCGIIILRDNKLLFQTTVQQHSFNCPYQLPHDAPSCGESAKLQIKEGDVFLCATDGVLDNIEIDDLVKMLVEVKGSGCPRVAEAIAKQASRNGCDQKFFSPFAQHACRTGYRYMGGKLDDITALVARVTPAVSGCMGTKDPSCPELIIDILPLG